MFQDGVSEEVKLSKSKQWFEETLDFYDEFFFNCKMAFDYHDGHQWSPEDLEILEEDGRPALTFNVTKARVRHHVGAHEDNRQEATLEAVGTEDQFAADVLNHLLKRLRRKSKADKTDRRVFKDGCICGKGDSSLDVFPDPKMPTWIKMEYARIDPQEVKWDASAREVDRSDARYLFWDKWMSREEFKVDYPDYADEIDDIMEMADDHGHARFLQTYGKNPRHDDGYIRTTDLKYYDRRKDMVRVVHMEYKKAFKRTFVHNPDSGRTREVAPELATLTTELFEEAEVIETWDEKVMWLEFIGDTVLYDGDPDVPYEGWSVDSYYYDIDYNSGLPVGMVWDLIDPQSELNKRHSQMLDMINSQTQPGTFAETGAAADAAEFELSLTKRGSVSWLNPGGAEKIKERKVPDFPEGVARMFDTGMKMIEVISGVFTDELTSPRGIPEAAATAQLKDRKSKLTQIDPIETFNDFQKQRTQKELETIIRAMPDDQIAHLLGNSDKYRVEEDVVYSVVDGFEMSLRSIRDIEFDVELQMSDTNQSQRLLELATLTELGRGGMPVDPSIMFELTTLRAETKAKLAKYAQQVQEQSSETEGRKQEFLNRQIEGRLEADMAKVQISGLSEMEKHRHNVATEIATTIENKRKNLLGFMQIWEKSDEAEKAALIKVAEMIEQRQAQRALPAQAGGA